MKRALSCLWRVSLFGLAAQHVRLRQVKVLGLRVGELHGIRRDHNLITGLHVLACHAREVAQVAAQAEAFLQLLKVHLILISQLDRVHRVVQRQFVLLLVLQLLLSLELGLATPALCLVELGGAALAVPAHLILLAGLLQILQAVEVLHGDQLPVEVLALEVFERAKAEDPLLLELPHQDLFHLLVGELAIVVEAESLDASLIILIQLNFVLNNLYACFEDTLIFHGLSNLDLACAGTLTFRWMRADGFWGRVLNWL